MTYKLVYELHEWAPGAPLGFPEGTSKEEIARYETLALDALVAAGPRRSPHRAGSPREIPMIKLDGVPLKTRLPVSAWASEG